MSINTIKGIAKLNFEMAASDFSSKPDADIWRELEKAMCAHQQAHHLSQSDKKAIEQGETPGAFLVRCYELYETEHNKR